MYNVLIKREDFMKNKGLEYVLGGGQCADTTTFREMGV